MLFTYKYMPHNLEKMQQFIDYIFYRVWCQAPYTEYSIDLFQGNLDLFKIMNELYRRDLAGKLKPKGVDTFFYQGVNDIFNYFKTLSKRKIKYLKKIYLTNNNIMAICGDNCRLFPVKYVDMKVNNEKIENFFKNLYSRRFFESALAKKIIGSDLSEYYKYLIQINKIDVCPFCGLTTLYGVNESKREAFDHYLPKGKYPFNSINLKNLVPSCNKCNSGYKLEQDPLYSDNGKRRKAFFPFSDIQPDIQLSIDIHSKNWKNYGIKDFSINITSNKFQEETETWKEMFDIPNRYLQRCDSPSGRENWLNRIFVERKNYFLDVNGMLKAELTCAKNSPWIDAHFIQQAFLEGCERAGLFDEYITDTEQALSSTNELSELVEAEAISE